MKRQCFFVVEKQKLARTWFLTKYKLLRTSRACVLKERPPSILELHWIMVSLRRADAREALLYCSTAIVLASLRSVEWPLYYTQCLLLDTRQVVRPCAIRSRGMRRSEERLRRVSLTKRVGVYVGCEYYLYIRRLVVALFVPSGHLLWEWTAS